MRRFISIVVMYHRVHDDDDDPDISVSTETFEHQIIYLKKKFRIVALEELIAVYKQRHQLKEDIVAITFDDGFKDNYANAYPLLRKYDVPAAIFVVTGWIGEKHGLSQNEILHMRQNNITFAAHTRNHLIVSELDEDALLSEISGSKTSLEEILQQEVKYFAYPKGKTRDLTEEAMRIVKEAGYEAAFSSENGLINADKNIFALSRLGIRDYPLFVFKVRVSGIFESRFFHPVRRWAGLT